ncbi:MAG: hypothetical protein HC888_16050 [Candidatus Competibacteraceae bacterium]|nr:hypothetical protein [Candidatus Competibacteraceae bacterium]
MRIGHGKRPEERNEQVGGDLDTKQFMPMAIQALSQRLDLGAVVVGRHGVIAR